METHEKYIRRCFELAKLGIGYVKTNPMVGSVIVHNGKIIGEGYHERYGEGHAEVNAVKSVKEEDKHLLNESTIYVSLEPCFHEGKTPPCVDLILGLGIPKVVISAVDPNPKVAGKSIEKLRNHGVEVISGFLEKEGRFVTRRFFHHFMTKRPYVILKYAQSKDGFLSQMNKQIWLTNPYSKRLVHKWRNEEAAILVGTNTVKVDNPSLTNRLWFGNSPVRLIIDRNLKLTDEYAVMDGIARTIIICEKAPQAARNVLLEYLEINFERGFLKQLLKKLYQLKISSVIIEGGAITLEHFIEKGLWNEARVFVGDKWLTKGIAAPILPIAPSKTQQIGSDILYTYYNSKTT